MPWTAVASAVAGSAVSSFLAPSGGQQSGAAAAADPFASQRGQYQTMLSQMMGGTGFTPEDPSYKWRFDQGQEATERRMAAGGFANSGNILTALTDYGQGQASTEYSNQFSRLSQLAGANVGSPAAAGQIIQGQNNQQQTGASAIGSTVGKAVGSSVGNWLQDAFTPAATSNPVWI